MKTVKLGDVFNIGSSKRVLKSQWQSSGVPFYRGREITRLANLGHADSELFIDKALYDSYAAKYGVPQPGDIMITAIGTIGNSYIVKPGDEFYFKDASVLWMKKTDIINSQYINHWIRSSGFRCQLEDNGTTVNTLTIGKLQRMEVKLPTLDEQQRIVTHLDEAFAKIDKAIENTEKNLQSIQELYEARFNNLMSEKLGGTVTLNDVCAIKSKLIDPRKSEYINCHHVGGANIESKTGRLIGLRTAREEKLISGKFAFDENTVLYSKIRPYLMKVARPDFAGICSADIYPLTPGFQIERDYLYYILLSKEFTGYAIAGSGRAGMPKVNRDHLFSYNFTLPPIDRQKEIINELNLLDTQVQKLQRLYQQKLVDLRALKQSLLREAFMTSEVE